jgi:CRP-like cAMP-binding protein
MENRSTTTQPGKNIVRNELLLALSPKDRDLLLTKLEYHSLPLRTVMYEAAQEIEHGYFVNSGLVSVLTVMSDGKSVEVGVCGKEGFIGLPLLAGFATSQTRMIVQGTATAFSIKPSDLQHSLKTCPELAERLQRYAHEFSIQATQIAACNRLHQVEERLARWLLMCQERVGGSHLELTQEFLSDMLGTRRASVTVAANILQKAGFLTYSRGRIEILNRKGLEDASCECYPAIIRQVDVWRKESGKRTAAD